MTAPMDCVQSPNGKHSHKGPGTKRRHTWVGSFPDYKDKVPYCCCVFCGGIVPDSMVCEADARRGTG